MRTPSWRGWSGKSDFFEAPASTRHHGAHPGSLLDHSLNVYHRLRAIVCVETYGTTTSDLLAEDVEETVAVLALLHDVCKVNCYTPKPAGGRTRKPDTGRTTKRMRSGTPSPWATVRKVCT